MLESFNAIELAIKNLNPTAMHAILTSEIGCTSENPNVKIIVISGKFQVGQIAKSVENFRYVGIINSSDINKSDMTKLLTSLISQNNKTIVKLSEHPLKCEIIYPTPNIGARHFEGNYEYSYGQTVAYDDSWVTVDGQVGWGVRIIDNAKTNYKSPLPAIKGVPVTVISRLFHKNQMPTLNLIDWDTTNITNMSYLFEDSQATSITGLSNFATANTTNMSGMFYNSKATSLDLSSFNTSKVSNMSLMFYESEATSLNVSSFDTSYVRNMAGMFFHSKAKTIVGIDGFNTCCIRDISRMFYGSLATRLDLSSFNIANGTNVEEILTNCLATKIVGIEKLRFVSEGHIL